jgi:23S rRNA (guanine745-N1)-methyltransferase
VSTAPPLDPRAVATLACPVCGAGLAAEADGLGCVAGHRFDRARQGHVTLLPPGHRPPSGDSAEMVADRVAFLDAGHYAGLTGALAAAVADGPEPHTLLDLGGGTGHHLAGVLDGLPGAVGVVLDSSPYAARRAARAHPRAVAVVADTWARLPVADSAVDRVLVVFAPRNGPEIARVLADDGRLVVVTPAADHLTELVRTFGLIHVDPDKADRVSESLGDHFSTEDTTTHRGTMRLSGDEIRALIGMTPSARHVPLDELPQEETTVTAAVDITLYRPA